MRAHSQRRLIWFMNVILGAGVVALVAWIVLDVTKAVADPAFLRPPWATKAVEDFKAQPTTNRSALKPPVSLKELEEIDRREFKTGGDRRFHWIYSGPLPPPPPPEAAVEEASAPIEDDLGKLGEVAFLVFIAPRPGQAVAEESIVFWEFGEQARKTFSPGEFIDPGDYPADAPPTSGIRLVDVKRKPERERLFALHYEVVGKDGQVRNQGVFVYDAAIIASSAAQGVVRLSGGATAAGATPGEASATPGVTGSGEPGAQPGIAPAPAGEAPMVVYDDSRTKADVNVDQKTFDWLKNSDADTIGKAVSTQVATDESGQVIGLQITGIAAETPADRFDVKPGDILVSIDDQPVKSRSDAMNIAQSMDPDVKRVKVVVDRRGRLVTFIIDPTDPKTRRAARALDDR